MAMNWFQEMFNPQRPGPGQMAWRDIVNEDSGEFSTGDMQEMYWKPDDMTPNPISNQGTGNSVEADQEAIRRRLLARMAEGKTPPGYNAATSETPQQVSVLGNKFDDTATVTPPLVPAAAGPSIASTVVNATAAKPVFDGEQKTLETFGRDAKTLFDETAGFLGDEDVWTGIFDDDVTKLLMGAGEVAGNVGRDAFDFVSDWSSTKDMSPGYDWIGDNPAIAAGGAAALGGAGIANRMLKGRTVKPISAMPDPVPTIDADKGPSRTSKVRAAINTGGNNLFRQLSGRGSPELETKIRETRLAAKNTGSVLAKPGLDNKVARLVAERPAIAKAARAAVTSPRAWKAYGVLALLGAAVGDAKAEEIYNAAMQPGSASANAINTAGMILEGIPGLAYAPDSPFDKGIDPFAASVGLGGKRKGEGISDIGWTVPKPWEAQPY